MKVLVGVVRVINLETMTRYFQVDNLYRIAVTESVTEVTEAVYDYVLN